MAKIKQPTSQDLYRARKQREELEASVLLPPGLINHGNTCFMNSVLQGLIATQLLTDLVHFSPIPDLVQRHTSTHISSRRSPQLTNGHGLAGEFEQKWVDSMPIGDVFLSVMQKAWDIQVNRKRESLSPKSLLGALGRKHDQYLDFAQQDAHEFLRLLLDAMRMEEFDVIKKRQPPPPPDKVKKQRRRMTITPSSPPSTSPAAEITDPIPIPEEEKLMATVDMIFGGRLTSILVCQHCKHVSQTYEDFNDLSLSIKAEDYARERKRDRLKNLTKKLFTPASGTAMALGAGLDANAHRSSSVPPPSSPRIMEPSKGMDEFPILVDESRRRSLDIPAEQMKEERVSGDFVKVEKMEPGATTPDDKRVEFAEQLTVEKQKEKNKKDGDGWAKIGRRISLTVGFNKGTKERKGRSRESRDLTRELKGSSGTTSSESIAQPIPIVPASISRASTGDLDYEHITAESAPEIRLSRPTSSPKRTQESDAESLPSTPKSRPPSIQFGLRGPSLSPRANPQSSPRFPDVAPKTRSKSPKPPKTSRAEADYLRHILADVGPTSSNNPFTLFKAQQNAAHSSASPSPRDMWLKSTGQLPGIEECLRMFTAVEILDGENMVGCRRCWKIANGVYEPRQPQDDGDDDDDEEEEDNVNQDGSAVDDESVRPLSISAPASPLQTPSIPTSISTPSISLYNLSNHNLRSSESSLPTTIATSVSDSAVVTTAIPPPPALTSSQYSRRKSVENGISVNTEPPPPVPSISTTAPDSPVESPLKTARPSRGFSAAQGLDNPDLPSSDSTIHEADAPLTARPAIQINGSRPTSPHIHVSDSKDSLLAAPRRPRHQNHRRRSDVDSTDESDGAESDVSASTSVYSADSSRSLFSPEPLIQNNVNGTTIDKPLSAAPEAAAPSVSKTKPKSKPKPVIMRPAYKRYLIATPPPVLVIHLKRFQQLSKSSMPMLSFSNGFKKLDDYVTFPEYLDLTPFLAPKKEDFGLGKKGERKFKLATTHKTSSKEAERCMYRLYAVVVHIGSMLGGHYIAYTALPSASDALGGDSAATLGSTPSLATSAHSSVKPTTVATHAPRQWAYISDTVVRLTTLEEVLKAKAYICMYERI